MNGKKKSALTWTNRAFAAAGILAVVAVAGMGAMRLADRAKVPPVAEEKPLPVETMRMKPDRFAKTRKYTGSIEAERSAVVSSQITATVEKVAADEGNRIAKGQILAVLDGEELAKSVEKLEAAMAKVKADLEFWRGQLTSDFRLFRAGAIPERALNDTRRRVKGLEAAFRESVSALNSARRRFSYSTVRAPIDGTVQKVFLREGELAVAGKPLAEIVYNGELKAVFYPSQIDVKDIKPRTPALLKVDAVSGVWSGTVDRITPALTGVAHTMRMEAYLPPASSAAARPGMSVTVEVEIQSQDSAIVVPGHAVRKINGVDGVFIMEGAAAAWKRVNVGGEQDGMAWISDGLDSGMEVILTPDPRITEGRAVKATNDWKNVQ